MCELFKFILVVYYLLMKIVLFFQKYFKFRRNKYMRVVNTELLNLIQLSTY